MVVFCSLDSECWDLPQSSSAQTPKLTLSLPPWGRSQFPRGLIPYCSAPPIGPWKRVYPSGNEGIDLCCFLAGRQKQLLPSQALVCVLEEQAMCSHVQGTSQAEKCVDLPQQEKAHTVSSHIISCIISIVLYLAKSRRSTQLCPGAAFICLTVPCSSQDSQVGLPDLGSITGI